MVKGQLAGGVGILWRPPAQLTLWLINHTVTTHSPQGLVRQGKVHHTPLESVGRCASPVPRSRRITNVCDTWPVWRRTHGYLSSCKASPPIGWYQIILWCARFSFLRISDRCTCEIFATAVLRVFFLGGGCGDEIARRARMMTVAVRIDFVVARCRFVCTIFAAFVRLACAVVFVIWWWLYCVVNGL